MTEDVAGLAAEASALTIEQREWLQQRIQQLSSRMRSDTYGPFRKAGIFRTLKGMRVQLKNNVWTPPQQQEITR